MRSEHGGMVEAPAELIHRWRVPFVDYPNRVPALPPPVAVAVLAAVQEGRPVTLTTRRIGAVVEFTLSALLSTGPRVLLS